MVDDSKVQRKILTAILRRWGYDVLEAASGEEGLDLCKSERPEFIISDWMMPPGMSGVEFCQAYRALGLEEYGYFILLTSRNEKTDIAMGLERGADDFLTKPVNSEELHGRITAGLRILRMQTEVKTKAAQLETTLAELREVHRALDRDLVEARRLQQSLVPERFRSFPGGDAAMLLRPSGHVGGDLVGMFQVSPTRIGLYGIDVAGHGIASALMTARLASYLSNTAPARNVALTGDGQGGYRLLSPSKICEILNHLIAEDLETDHYFTMVFADCDLETGKVVLAQAGHPSPLLMRDGGEMEFIGDGGMPIGLIDGATYHDIEVQMEPGDRLLIYSDGVTECPAPGGDMLEPEGLADLAIANHKLSGPEFFEALVWDLVEFAGGDDFPDDVSAALFDRKAPPEPAPETEDP